MPLTVDDIDEPSPRDDLIIQIMLMLDRTIEGEARVTTWSIAEQIIELVEMTTGSIDDDAPTS